MSDEFVLDTVSAAGTRAGEVSQASADSERSSEEIAGAAVFLSSSAADYVNGHVLVVDGGWTSTKAAVVTRPGRRSRASTSS